VPWCIIITCSVACRLIWRLNECKTHCIPLAIYASVYTHRQSYSFFFLDPFIAYNNTWDTLGRFFCLSVYVCKCRRCCHWKISLFHASGGIFFCAMRVSMFANADRYAGYWFSCELLLFLFFFFPLLLLIAGINDDSSSRDRNRTFAEKEKKKTTKYACKHPPHTSSRRS